MATQPELDPLHTAEALQAFAAEDRMEADDIYPDRKRGLPLEKRPTAEQLTAANLDLDTKNHKHALYRHLPPRVNTRVDRWLDYCEAYINDIQINPSAFGNSSANNVEEYKERLDKVQKRMEASNGYFSNIYALLDEERLARERDCDDKTPATVAIGNPFEIEDQYGRIILTTALDLLVDSSAGYGSVSERAFKLAQPDEQTLSILRRQESGQTYYHLHGFGEVAIDLTLDRQGSRAIIEVDGEKRALNGFVLFSIVKLLPVNKQEVLEEAFKPLRQISKAVQHGISKRENLFELGS
jgi:hypothetical protein